MTAPAFGSRRLLRDFSGDVSVWITEAAALPLSRLATRADFEAAFEAGEL